MEEIPTGRTSSEGYDLMGFMRDYWFVLLFVGSSIIAFAQMEIRVSSLETQMTAVQTQESLNNSAFNDVKNSITEIKTSLGFIESAVGVKKQ